jgi:glycine cleavage system H protein
VYAPVSVTVTGVNAPLKDDNSLINREAEKGGWMIKVKLNKPEQVEKLMDRKKYDELLANEKH